MEKSEFLLQEFLTVREEVKETKDRIFKTMGFGLVVVPASDFVAQSSNIGTITLSLPILVVVVALIYLSENNALMRCGRYIRTVLEPEMAHTVGWERWLEMKENYGARDVDKYLSYAFYLLFFVYFVGAVFLASQYSYHHYGLTTTWILRSLYAAIGALFLSYLFRRMKVSTSTAGDVGEA